MISRLFSVVVFLLIEVIAARAEETLASVIASAEAAEARSDVATALSLYRHADALQPNNAVLLQKVSKQLSDSTEEMVNPEDRKKRVEEALEYAKRAVALAPKNPVCVLSLAVCYGKLTATADNATRVEYSRLVKRYAEEALALDPRYAWAHHVLGKWNFEVAQIGGPTRFAARVLYGGLPPASYGDAIKHLEKAVELQPNTPSHHVELGFVYLGSGDRSRGVEQLKTAVSLPALEKHDETCKARARAALERMGL